MKKQLKWKKSGPAHVLRPFLRVLMFVIEGEEGSLNIYQFVDEEGLLTFWDLNTGSDRNSI